MPSEPYVYQLADAQLADIYGWFVFDPGARCFRGIEGGGSVQLREVKAGTYRIHDKRPLSEYLSEDVGE